MTSLWYEVKTVNHVTPTYRLRHGTHYMLSVAYSVFAIPARICRATSATGNASWVDVLMSFTETWRGRHVFGRQGAPICLNGQESELTVDPFGPSRPKIRYTSTFTAISAEGNQPTNQPMVSTNSLNQWSPQSGWEITPLLVHTIDLVSIFQHTSV